MTWEELKEEAKKMGYSLEVDYTDSEFLYKYTSEKRYCFRQEGAIDDGRYYGIIAENRTTDQMLAIMKALQ